LHVLRLLEHGRGSAARRAALSRSWIASFMFSTCCVSGSKPLL
jgi:hypothetical protein